jgi:DNA replication protein DnaC
VSEPFEGHSVKFLVAYGPQQVLEGDAPEGVVIVEFPSTAAARAWYDSPAYQQVAQRNNAVIIGATGLGKTWLACALANQACRHGFSALYLKMPRLNEELAIAHGSGRIARLLGQWAKTDVLLMDDFAMVPMTDGVGWDLLEILDDRHGHRSTLVTSQIPVENWHAALGDPTLADAILDRLVHNTYRINLSGESMRKRKKSLTTNPQSE